MNKKNEKNNFDLRNFINMEIATIENEQIPTPVIYKHNYIQILYMITSTICFIIEVYQRISTDLSYTSC